MLDFVVLFIIAIAGEIFFLARRGWATGGRAAGYVLVTDLLALGFAAAVAAVGFTIMLMMAFGASGMGGTSSDASFVALIAVTALLPLIFLILVKRFFLFVFKITSGGPAWVYAAAVSLLIVVLTIAPPAALLYFTTYSSQ